MLLGILGEVPPPAETAARRVRFARSASAPLPRAVQDRFEAESGIGVLETYGMTEAASQIAANPLARSQRRPGSAGRPAGVPVRIVGADGGSVVAFHLDAVDDWLRRHARLVIALTAAAALGAEAIYFLAEAGVTTALGSGNDPFQPSVIPFNVGAIACLYLLGVALVKPGRSRRLRAVVRSGSDNSYGIYLAQMLFINALIWLGWAKLDSVVWWPLLCAATVIIVYLGCVALTSLLARTPLAVPLTGRQRQPWASLLPRRAAAPLATPPGATGCVQTPCLAEQCGAADRGEHLRIHVSTPGSIVGHRRGAEHAKRPT